MTYIDILLKECKSHVFLAPTHWLQDKVRDSRCHDLSSLNADLFGDILKGLFDYILVIPSITEAIVRMCIVIAMLESKTIETPSYTDVSVPHSKSTRRTRKP